MKPEELKRLMKFDPTSLPLFFGEATKIYESKDLPRFGRIVDKFKLSSEPLTKEDFESMLDQNCSEDAK